MKLDFYKLPGLVKEAIDDSFKFSFEQVVKICSVYTGRLENEGEDEITKEEKKILKEKLEKNRDIDSFLLLKFARFCRTASGAISKKSAEKMFDIRNMLCHSMVISEEKYNESMRDMKECMDRCRPF